MHFCIKQPAVGEADGRLLDAGPTRTLCGGFAAAEGAGCDTYSPRLVRIIRRCSAVQFNFPMAGFYDFRIRQDA